jgi:hypothetical protein
MAKYLSNRQKNLKVGIVSYTESNTVLEVTGKVGIGTTNATSTLSVVGDTNVTGVVTANSFSGSGSALTGIVTSITAGSGISVNQNTGNVTITATGGGGITGVTIQDEGSIVGVANSITTLNFVGANVSATASGSISTITVADNLVGTALSISGISTFTNGPVLVGSSSSTGTASQRLQVTGGVYVSGSVGIGTTNPTSKLSVVGDGNFTGVVTATTFFGALTGTATTASSVTVNSVGLGTHTYGDYVKDITGTANQITVTSGTGEGSSPTLSIPSQFTAPQDVTVTRDLQVNRNLNVNGNITIGGTSATLFTTEFKVYDPDIVLGFRTDANNNDVSTDTTANHGGIAIASTEGTPLVSLYDVGVGETNPATYKKFMWFKSGTFSGLGTDAWLSNYAIGIGSTQVPNGVRLAAGGMQVTDRTLSVPQLNISGVSTFQGNVSFASSAYFGDNDRIIVGDSGDLQIYHNGANSVIQDIGTGSLLLGGTAGVEIRNFTFTETSAKFLTDGAVELYYDNVKEFETTGYGATVFGILQTQGLQVSGVSTVGFITATNIWNAGITTSSRITLNGANNTTTGGGQIYLNGTTGNRIDFNTNGTAAPTTTTRSAGTKIVLFPELSASAVDYALGIQSFTLWTSVPQANNSYQHRWYAGTTQLADLKGSGELVIGTQNLTGTSNQRLQIGSSGTPYGAYISGSLGVGITNPLNTFSVNQSSNGTIASLYYTGSTGGGSEIRVNNGYSNTVPIYSFWFNNTTGLGNPSANVISTIISGTERSRTDSSGNFLINNTSATGTASQRLQVTGGGYISGNTGIGTTNPTSKLSVVGDVLVSGIITSTDYNSTSDINLKENIQRIENPVDKVLQLNGVSFNWKESGRASMGVIAQEVERVIPELVNTGDVKTVNYNGLIGVLIEVVKEQQKEIDYLKGKIG